MKVIWEFEEDSHPCKVCSMFHSLYSFFSSEKTLLLLSYPVLFIPAIRYLSSSNRV